MSIPLVAALLVSLFSYWPPPVLDPATYRSLDDRYLLLVDPSEPDGSGPAFYRLTRNGASVWERSLPFTFFDASIGGDGTVAGVSYSRGLAGGPYGEAHGDLRLVVLEHDGGIRFERSFPRRDTLVIHGHPGPQSRGVLLDEIRRRVLMRWSSDGVGGEQWWFYDLDTGEQISRFEPGTVDGAYLKDLRRIGSGKGLLAHWESTDVSRFRVLNAELRSEWSFEVAHGGDARASIHAVTGSVFVLNVASMSELAEFTVTDASGVLRVRETGRRALPAPTDPLVTLPRLELPLLDTIELGGSGRPPNPVRNVYDFDIDERGRFGFARCDTDGSALVLVDVEGSVIDRN